MVIFRTAQFRRNENAIVKTYRRSDCTRRIYSNASQAMIAREIFRSTAINYPRRPNGKLRTTLRTCQRR